MKTERPPFDPNRWEKQPFTALELKVRRIAMGLTPGQLAHHFNVTARSIERWESGVNPIPTVVEKWLVEVERDYYSVLDDLLLAFKDKQEQGVVPELALDPDNPSSVAVAAGVYLMLRAEDHRITVSPNES